LGTLFVAGTITNASILIDSGNVGIITASAMIDSINYVGYTPDDPANPLSGGTFSPDFRLGSISVRAPSGAFVDSFIVAPIIGGVRLRSVAIDNDRTPFGVLAGQSISSVAVQSPPFKFVPPPRGANNQSLGDFHVIP
jgi:hypothetical protein